MASSEAENLKVIAEAIDQHKENCPGKLLAVLMNPFEVARLDWDEIKGVPIKPDEKIGTGRFRLACDGIHDNFSSSAEKQAPDSVEKVIPIPEPVKVPELDPVEPTLV